MKTKPGPSDKAAEKFQGAVKSSTARKALGGRLRAISRRLSRPFLLLIRRVRHRHLPIAMITGSKGKTTTTRMLAHILSGVDHVVGFATTDSITVGGKLVSQNDTIGYRGHERVLKDRTITSAVLEAGRGGILRRGLYLDRCNVAALLNVGREQIGKDGIDTVEQMVRLKQQVIDAAQDTIVLNAGDPLCAELIGEYPVDRVTIFSMNSEIQIVRDHLEAGGKAYCLDEEEEPQIVQMHASDVQTIVSIADLPSAWGGIVRHNIANAMAAAALADGLGVPVSAIAKGLQSFENSINHSPGRFNVIEEHPFLLILDSAVHPPSAEAFAECLTRIRVNGQRRCAMAGVDNRPDWHYHEVTKALSKSFDSYVCYESDSMRRGSAPGEIAELLKSHLISNGVSDHSIEVVNDLEDALKVLSANTEPGDLVVVLDMLKPNSIPVIRKAFATHYVYPQETTQIC